jgi:hypothetical protein
MYCNLNSKQKGEVVKCDLKKKQKVQCRWDLVHDLELWLSLSVLTFPSVEMENT